MDQLLDEISAALSDTTDVDVVTADLLAEAANGDDEARSAVRAAVEGELADLIARVSPRASDQASAVLEALATPGSHISWVGGSAPQTPPVVVGGSDPRGLGGGAPQCAFDPTATANCALTVDACTVMINNKTLVNLYVIHMLANYAATPKLPFALFEACRLRVQKMI